MNDFSNWCRSRKSSAVCIFLVCIAMIYKIWKWYLVSIRCYPWKTQSFHPKFVDNFCLDIMLYILIRPCIVNISIYYEYVTDHTTRNELEILQQLSYFYIFSVLNKRTKHEKCHMINIWLKMIIHSMYYDIDYPSDLFNIKEELEPCKNLRTVQPQQFYKSLQGMVEGQQPCFDFEHRSFYFLYSCYLLLNENCQRPPWKVSQIWLQ